jgi:hypothetical protein
MIQTISTTAPTDIITMVTTVILLVITVTIVIVVTIRPVVVCLVVYNFTFVEIFAVRMYMIIWKYKVLNVYITYKILFYITINI